MRRLKGVNSLLTKKWDEKLLYIFFDLAIMRLLQLQTQLAEIEISRHQKTEECT